MVGITEIIFVFIAGLITALATGIGALPFFLFDDISDRWNVALWGLASGIMLAASFFGLVFEGLAASNGVPTLLVGGLIAGIVLVVLADELLDHVDLGDMAADQPNDPVPAESVSAAGGGNSASGTSPATPATHSDGHAEEAPLLSVALAEGDLRKLLLILGVLTVHSFPEGIAVGVAFADLGLAGGVQILGLSVPFLAIFMTAAISVQNIPEGVAVSIPLRSMGVSEWRMVGAAIFSSLPQPIGAVLAFGFVTWARAFLPFGFGFAAGAMIYLVFAELIPEALDIGESIDGNGYRELAGGLVVGILGMVPLLLI